MINLNEVIAYFDALAPQWDAGVVRSEEVIGRILDNAKLFPGCRVLDVACGTGVLIPDYLARDAGNVTAVDVSPEMIRIAAEKFPVEKVRFICGDVENVELEGGYDSIVVYNAFPHFQDGRRLIRRLASLLSPGGTLTVAHSMSREALNIHHSGVPESVTNRLMPPEELEDIFKETLEITAMISDESMFQLAGQKAQ